MRFIANLAELGYAVNDDLDVFSEKFADIPKVTGVSSTTSCKKPALTVSGSIFKSAKIPAT